MSTWIWLRPWWFLAMIPIIIIAIYGWFRGHARNDWFKYCDALLIQYFQQQHSTSSRKLTGLTMLGSLILIVIALAGPSWEHTPTAVAQIQQPVVIVMDLSRNMLLDDISPSRLERAKFLLEDELKASKELQWGMVVFSGAAFVVSPITSDIQNILNFLPVLKPEILPIGGYQVEQALQKAQVLLRQSGYRYGKILIVSTKNPDSAAMSVLAHLRQQGFDWFWLVDSSVITPSSALNVMNMQQSEAQLRAWLYRQNTWNTIQHSLDYKVMQWRDEGRWFLLMAMLLLLFVFRKGWLLRLWV